MRLSNADDLGRYLRDRRRAAGLSQDDLAARATVSRRWLSDLEQGKPTVEVGLVFKAIAALGLYLDCRAEPAPELDASGAGMIRAARDEDAAVMVAIEAAAGRLFATVGMEFVAEDDPGTVEELLPYVRDGRAWVADGPDGAPVGYLIAEWVDGNVHVEQVSVDPRYGRQGIGSGLIEHVARWATERGAPALTLTTYANVGWNAPYYERLGFRRLADDELTPGLRAIRAAEAAHGLDRWPRLGMRRELCPPAKRPNV